MKRDMGILTAAILMVSMAFATNVSAAALVNCGSKGAAYVATDQVPPGCQKATNPPPKQAVNDSFNEPSNNPTP